jgi:hypothetical protein
MQGGSVASTPGSGKKPRLKHEVCKPCWELKYCPYGPMVEYFPGASNEADLDRVREYHDRAWDMIKAAGDDSEMFRAVEMFLHFDVAQWEWIAKYDAEDLRCMVFGHACPVFFVSEGLTETREGRASGRHISRDVMLKVVRRDGQVCQICHQPVPDNQVEFDHVIPFSRGGPATPDNLRVACRSCNRKKRDSLGELLEDPFRRARE